MKSALVLLLGAAVVAALPAKNELVFKPRIVGGDVTSIQQHPYMVAMLRSVTGNGHTQACGGAIINNRSILTAAHCFMFESQAFQWRGRVGSTNANSGGTVVNTQQIFNHPQFNRNTLNMDFAVLRIQGTFNFNNLVQPASIAGPNYSVGDNQPMWAVGWGATCWFWCSGSEQLRHVQVFAINQEVCRTRYLELPNMPPVNNNMLCAGVLDIGGSDACQGDSGGPLLHNNVIVGVTSWGHQCAHARYPGVNARVSIASNWIVSNV
ncbi:trypsin domain-containing protein [Phthorimaea operculella]|nr:trypsin domain-containing protein [Phthorimaea operculella]